MAENGTTAVMEPNTEGGLDIVQQAEKAGMETKAAEEARRDVLASATAYVNRAAGDAKKTEKGADYARPAKPDAEEEPKAEDDRDAGDEDDAADDEPGDIDVGHVIDLDEKTEGTVVGFTRDGKSALVKVDGEDAPRRVALSDLASGADEEEEADDADAKKPGKPKRASALQTVLDGLGISDEDAEEAEDKLLGDFERQTKLAEQQDARRRAGAERAGEEDPDEPEGPRTRAGQSRSRVRAAAEAIAEGDTDEANLGDLTAAELDKVLETVDEGQKPVIRRLAAMEKRLAKAEAREGKQAEALQAMNAKIAWAGLHPMLDRLGAPGNSEDGLSPDDDDARKEIVHRAFLYQQGRIQQGKQPLSNKQAIALSVHNYTQKHPQADTPAKGKAKAKENARPDAGNEDQRKREERIQRRHRMKDIGPRRPGAGGGAKDPQTEVLEMAKRYVSGRA